MTEKNVFVAEDLSLHGIGDESISVTQTSQIVKHSENTTFSDKWNVTEAHMCLVHVYLFSIIAFV